MLEVDPVVNKLEQWIEVFMRHSMRDFIRFAKDRGLSISQLGALLNLYHSGSCGVSDLGDILGVTSAAASQMLERLVRQDLIFRYEDPNDRRVKQIVLTDEGQKLVQEGIHARQTWLGDLAETLSTSQKEQIVITLETLIDKANHLDQENVLLAKII